MSFINRLEDYEEYYLQGMQHEQGLQKSSIETLPTAVISKIFSYLGKDLQRVTSVNERLCEVAIGTAKHQNLSAIQSFVNFICNYLGDSHADQKKQLLNSVNGTKILNSVNLYQVKSSLNEVKETVLNVLKNLDVPDLENLEELSKNETIPLFFEDLIFRTRMTKLTIKANAMIDPQKSEALGKIVDALLEKGKIEDATKIAHTIPFGIGRQLAYRLIITALLKNGDTAKAIKIADRVHKIELQRGALSEIVDALLKKDDIKEATRVANKLPHFDLKESAVKKSVFKKILMALLKKGDIEEATKLEKFMNELPTFMDELPTFMDELPTFMDELYSW